MKRAAIALAVLAVLAVVVLASFKAGSGEKGAKVYAEEVERRDITEVVKASGELDARVKVNISSHLIGKIEKLYVEEGDEIAAGEPFLELEKEAFIAARDDWASRLEIALNDVEQARVNLADAEIKAKRAERLYEEGIITSEALEAAELALASAQLRLERSRQAVRQAEANLIKAKDDLAKTTLYAPLAGRVVSLQAEEGEVVVSGTMNNPASVIGTIADLSEILAEVDVDETEIVKVRVGQAAELKVDAVPHREYRGRVVEVGSSGYSRPQQPDVTFFQVKLLFEDPGPELLPGMSVRADIETDFRSEVRSVPIQSVVQRPPVDGEGGDGEDGEEEEIPVVFVLADGRAEQRPVETGLSDDTHVEVTAGLEGGETVVTGPYRVLKDLEHEEPVRVRSASDEEEAED